MTLQIGFVLFPGIQQLDLTGPYDVLGSLPDVKSTSEPVHTEVT
jgi:cyclohexyl-isocyanide hydratase